jgi:hypothetical protein
VLSDLTQVRRPLGALASALPDLLVHAEREQLDKQFLPLAGRGLQEFRESALRQQHRLREVLVAEPEQFLHPGADLVRTFGDLVSARLEELGQRRVGRYRIVEALKACLLRVHASLVARQSPHRRVSRASGLEYQADAARVRRRRERVGDHVLPAPSGHGAVEREAQAVDHGALSRSRGAGQREEVDVVEVDVRELAVGAETVEG